MRQSVYRVHRRGGWRRITPFGLGVLALLIAACDTDEIINLPDPDLITRLTVQDTANLPQIRNGVLFEFARAMSGEADANATPGIVGLSGLLADEIWYASTFTSMREIDARNIDVNNADLLDAFQNLQRARNLAERTAELYATSPRENTADHALVTNLAGFTYISFAENFCSGVPFSQTSFGAQIEYGPGQTTQQMYELAIARFDAAIAIATAVGGTDGTTQLNLARVGKARAQLGLGQYAQAAATVTGVPDNFAFRTEYGDLPAPQNGVWFNINSARRSSVASQEGNNGLRFFNRGPSGTNTIDTRTPADSLGRGIGTQVAHYRQLKYTAGNADIVIASGIEAQLIRAEAALNTGAAGSTTTYLNILNTLRGTVGLANLTAPATPQARVLQFFEERAKWLWLTGHRLGDLRRIVSRYGVPQNQVYPTGTTIFGASYGNDVNLPIPFAEANNPSFSGQCIDRNP